MKQLTDIPVRRRLVALTHGWQTENDAVYTCMQLPTGTTARSVKVASVCSGLTADMTSALTRVWLASIRASLASCCLSAGQTHLAFHRK